MSIQATATSMRWLRRIILFGAVGLGGYWVWQSDLGQQLHMVWRLQRMPIPTALPVPVEAVAPRLISDTWGATRGNGRHHQGVDIFAKRGTTVRSTTPGVVLRLAEFGIGGKHVWIMGPAGERHYYAHLDAWASGMTRGARVDVGTPIGVVGNTGNAKGTPPHLHYGIYGTGGARNPWPLLQHASQSIAPQAKPAGS